MPSYSYLLCRYSIIVSNFRDFHTRGQSKFHSKFAKRTKKSAKFRISNSSLPNYRQWFRITNFVLRIRITYNPNSKKCMFARWNSKFAIRNSKYDCICKYAYAAKTIMELNTISGLFTYISLTYTSFSVYLCCAIVICNILGYNFLTT